MKLNYLQFPVIRDLGAGTLKKTRALTKKNAEGLSKKFKDPTFRSNEKIMKYKKQKYYG